MKIKQLLSMAVVIMLILTTFGAVYAAESDNPAYAHALALREAGIIYGMGDGTFGLDQPFLRSEAIAVLLRALNLSDEAAQIAYEPIFTDVPEDYWGAKDIIYAYKNKMTAGTSETEFSPEDNVTAQEFCTLMLRYMLEDPTIKPDNVFGYIVTQTPLDIDFITKCFAKDVFTRDDMVEIVYAMCIQQDVTGDDKNTDENNDGDAAVVKGEPILPDTTSFFEVGNTFYIEVQDNASTGYHWEVMIPDEQKGVVELADTVVEAPDAEAGGQPIVGAPSTVTYIFKALEAGAVNVTMANIGPGEDPESELYGYMVVVTEPGGKVVTLDKDKDNEMALDGFAVLELESNSSTGYSWSVDDNDYVELVADTYYQSDAAKADPMIAGAAGKQVFVFKAVKAGTTEIKLNYTRSFEKNAKPADTAAIKLVIK